MAKCLVIGNRMKLSNIFNKKKTVLPQQNNKMADNTENPQNIDITEEQENISETIQNDSEPTEKDELVLTEEEKLKAEVATLNDKFVRLYAEFDNFKRRTQKERSELLKTANKEVIVAMLPVLDDFARADKALENVTDAAVLKDGMAIIQHKLKTILTQKGLTPMEAIGKNFDADIHEAITSIPSPTPNDKGKVIDEMEKGYLLNDKVVRFAKVIIGA